MRRAVETSLDRRCSSGSRGPADDGEPPTAIFASNNRMSVGAVKALAAAADPPGSGRIALVGFDDFELADVLTPPVSVVAYDLPALGRRAAEDLFDRLAGDAGPARRVVMPTWIVARGSGEVPFVAAQPPPGRPV